jgi:FHS family L-fucose permease-like MFS transporter
LWALIGVGLFNSIMLTHDRRHGATRTRPAGEGSDLLCTAIAGGAMVPFLQGLLADATGLHLDPVLRHPLRATRSGRVAFPA